MIISNTGPKLHVISDSDQVKNENLPKVGSSVFAKILCSNFFYRHYLSPLNTFMRKGKDPDPYLWLMELGREIFRI